MCLRNNPLTNGFRHAISGSMTKVFGSASVLKKRRLAFFVSAILLLASHTASAQTNWVGQFLSRYKTPAIDPSSRITPQVSDASLRLMVQNGVLPLGVGDVIRLMLS